MDETNFINQLVAMISRSESRIDRTNAMVNKLSDTASILCAQYEKHIDALTDNRDRLVREIEKLTAMLADERKRNDALVERILAWKNAINNINVK